MFDFLKRRELVFSCKITDTFLYNSLPPKLSSQCLPTWYKELKPHYELENKVGLIYKTGTVRHCAGIKKTLTSGVIVPMWSDLLLQINPDGTFLYQFSDEASEIRTHDGRQYGNLFRDSIILKLASPWACEANRPMNYYLTHPTYHIGYETEFQVLPGYIDFYYTNALNPFIICKVKPEPYRFMIPGGSPLYQLLPVHDHRVKIKTQVVSLEKFESLTVHNRFSFVKTHDRFVKYKNMIYGKK